MNSPLILSGLYDQKLFKSLLGLQDLGLGFDFRPKSFNFLQQHIFNEMLPELVASQRPVMMKFFNEKQFLITKFMVDIEKKVGFLPKNFFLEIQGDVDFGLESYNLPLPIVYHLSLREPYIPQHFQDHLRMIVIDDLAELLNDEAFIWKQYKNLLKLYPWVSVIDLGLKIDWSTDLSFAWLQTLNIKFLLLEINHHVEDGYRQVNSSKLNSGLKYYLNMAKDQEELLTKIT